MAYTDHPLARSGFVTSWLVSGVKTWTPVTDIHDANQLSFERSLRGEIAPDDGFTPPEDIQCGAPGCGGKPWTLNAQGEDRFVDLSSFYALLQGVEAWAYTCLVSPEAQQVEAVFWSYCALDVYLDGQRVLQSARPVYKPIKRESCRLTLKQGENRLFVRFRALGARDTRTLFAMKLPENAGIVLRLCGKAESETPNTRPLPELLPKNAEAQTEARQEALFARVAEIPKPVGALLRRRRAPFDQDDVDLLRDAINEVLSRSDCSDFTLATLLRIHLLYGLPEGLKQDFQTCALRFRYWMDEEGQDGMCFWSENHAILYFGNQHIAGRLFPEERFLASGRTGKEQGSIGRERCLEWLRLVQEYGFEEFNSSSYAPVTAAALLNLIDFGEEEIKQLAKRALDRLLCQLALHVFDGSVISPQGRIYGDVLTPPQQGVTALMNLLLPGMRDSITGWLAFFDKSAYRPPEMLKALADTPANLMYTSGKAQIVVNKTEDYMLTSCASPTGAEKLWDSGVYQTLDPAKTGHFSYAWTRALNERFHGTTKIEPGTFGYQQHLMYASLKGGAVSFVNHPGATSPASRMRPGYWYGNGVMPALQQQGSALGIVYCLGSETCIDYTHAFFPTEQLDESELVPLSSGSVLFGRAGDGYIALWCSGQMEKWNEAYREMEFRLYERKCAWLYLLGCKKEEGSYDAFRQKFLSALPHFDPDKLRLRGFGIDMSWTPSNDDTQYLE